MKCCKLEIPCKHQDFQLFFKKWEPNTWCAALGMGRGPSACHPFWVVKGSSASRCHGNHIQVVTSPVSVAHVQLSPRCPSSCQGPSASRHHGNPSHTSASGGPGSRTPYWVQSGVVGVCALGSQSPWASPWLVFELCHCINTAGRLPKASEGCR